MTEQQEGMLTFALYIFFATCISLPFIVWWLSAKANKVINKADKILDYVETEERDSRKYGS